MYSFFRSICTSHVDLSLHPSWNNSIRLRSLVNPYRLNSIELKIGEHFFWGHNTFGRIGLFRNSQILLEWKEFSRSHSIIHINRRHVQCAMYIPYYLFYGVLTLRKKKWISILTERLTLDGLILVEMSNAIWETILLLLLLEERVHGLITSAISICRRYNYLPRRILVFLL